MPVTAADFPPHARLTGPRSAEVDDEVSEPWTGTIVGDESPSAWLPGAASSRGTWNEGSRTDGHSTFEGLASGNGGVISGAGAA